MGVDSIIQTKLRQLRNFLMFTKSYFRRHNPIKIMKENIEKTIKDILTTNKKMKMIKYRLNLQKYRMNKMEQIIAQSSDHVFLKGRKINKTS